MSKKYLAIREHRKKRIFDLANRLGKVDKDEVVAAQNLESSYNFLGATLGSGSSRWNTYKYSTG